MATVCTVEPSLLPLLETLEDSSVSPAEQTDAWLTIANRLSGEEGKDFTTVIENNFTRICRVFKGHISGENSELINAALQALGFSLFHKSIADELAVTDVEDLLSTLCGTAEKSSDKNTCIRALWVISKQHFQSEIVEKKVSDILTTIENILKGDVPSMIIEYEALNVIVRLLEQTPAQMGENAERWGKIIIPFVIHCAPKVRLRAATALELGMPHLLQKQQELSSLTEQLMNMKLISELQKLFTSKNETYVLKLWPLFVKLLGKSLHRGGSFINSLLHLEELGFRSGSPVVKKIAFLAWKSLIDNFSLNPDILSSSKRLKLLMQPLSSIHVRTEALVLVKVEVWWYLVKRLGAHLPHNFEQVCVPLLQSTLATDPSGPVPGTPSRTMANQNINPPNSAQKPGTFPFGSPNSSRISPNSNAATGASISPAIQLLGIEMILHFFLGPEVSDFAVQHKVIFSLEPLQCPLINSASFFTKHASTFLNAVRDGYTAVGKDASNAVLNRIWKDILTFVRTAIETGNKKDRQGSEVLTLLLQTLQHIVLSDALPPATSMALVEATIKGLPQKVLGSAAYQVANMDILNGTPALFLIQLLFHGSLLECCVSEERFFQNLETLVDYVLSGPTSPLAFSESVMNVLNQSVKLLDNKEHLWRMWSIIANPLTDCVNQTNEVNQGDALEHNFSAMYSALTLPVCHVFPIAGFPQPTMKSLLKTWSELYRAFARCASLVVTAEENVCCEELCTRILSTLEDEVLLNISTLEASVHILTVMNDCINFGPYSNKFQSKTRTPPTPTTNWSKKKQEPLGNLTALLKLLVRSLNAFHILGSKDSISETPVSSMVSVGSSILSIIQHIFSHLSLPSLIHAVLDNLTTPLAAFFEKSSKSPVEQAKIYNALGTKLEKLIGEILQCLQSHCASSYDSKLLGQLSPLLCTMFLHKNKQIHAQVCLFWNATFGKTTTLDYPEQLKSVLSKVKQKTPLLCPAFETVDVPDESSGPYVDAVESSQLSTKISGMEVKSVGKRESLLSRAEELKEKGTPTRVAPAKLKLDFSSPKRACRELLLEEEKSVDFVFIPPTQPKERVLTEHQKEVLRTKRVDIPTMYNNLDASQDATLFSQYSQSQTPEDVEKPLSETQESAKKVHEDCKGLDTANNAEMTTEVSNEDELIEHPAKIQTADKTTNPDQDPDDMLTGNARKEDSLSDSALASSESTFQDVADLSSSSASSDIISGTPQKPVSRRQSFITLEKFDGAENRSFSPSALNKLGSCASKNVRNKETKVENCQTNELCKSEKNLNSSRSERKGPSVSGRKKSTQRQKRIEQTISKPSEPEGHSELENNCEEPMDTSEAVDNNFDSVKKKSEPNESVFIPDTEMSIAEPVVGVKSLADNVAAIESKENTPPEVQCDTAGPGDVKALQVSTNQKTLRRSSRKRSEVTAVMADSQDKEEVVELKEDVKENYPRVLKSGQDLGEDQKILNEKIVEEQTEVSDGKDMAEKTADKIPEKASQNEVTKGTLNQPDEDCFIVEEASDSNTDKGSQEAVRGRSRYQTRRASQGLLSSIENSESDNSETREEGQRRKRATKRTAKTAEPPDNKEVDQAEGNTKESSPLTESTDYTNESKPPPGDLKCVVNLSGPDNENSGTVDDSLGSLTALKTAEQDSVMIHEPDTAAERIFVASEGAETDLKTCQLSKTSKTCSSNSTMDVIDLKPSSVTEPKVEDTSSVSDVSSSSENNLQVSECRHKRSRRIRKSKNCDCCTVLQQEKTNEKPYTELKAMCKPSVRESKKNVPQISTVVTSEYHSEENILEPCAVSTPLSSSKELLSFKPSANELESSGVFEDRTLSVKEFSVSKLETKETLATEVHPVEENDAEQTDVMETALPFLEENKAEHITVADILQPVEENCNRVEHTVIKERVQHPVEENCSADVRAVDELVEKYIEPSNAVVENEQFAATDLPKLSHSSCNEGTDINASVKNTEDTDSAKVDQNVEELCQATQIEESCLTSDRTIKEQETSTENGTMPSKSELLISSDLPHETVNVESPQKLKGVDSATLVVDNQSPSGLQPRCVWSPSASPSTGILKKGVKRSSENDSPSPVNKIRRVSFANPIYQEGLADDIDRRSPVVRSSSTNTSPASKGLKALANTQTKLITTPTKGFLSPGSRSPGIKSSKKCLITEMSKQPLSPKDSVYPALVGCAAPVDLILPQITSNMWARGLGQLVRAKNIKTVGDLSALSAGDIKTLPIRSPKVLTVKMALKQYHEQQKKSQGLEEIAALEENEKQVDAVDKSSENLDEEKLATDLSEADPAEQTSVDLLAEMSAFSMRLTPEELSKYSGSQLFAMQDKLSSMMNSIMGTLQSRWCSPPHDGSV